jgi:hypothetical protein
MKKFAINEARKPPRIGSIAIISGTLLGAIAAAGPAQTADLYNYPYQYSGYRPYYNGYYRPCNSCGCYSCGCYRCGGCCGVARHPVPDPVVAVAERHWVQRDYWERRYPTAYPYPYSYPSGYRYSYYSGGYADGYPYPPAPVAYAAPPSEPRPRLGFGGIQYGPGPGPGPVSYQYDPPRSHYGFDGPRAPAPYVYDAPRTAYEYDAPRPPYGANVGPGPYDYGAPRPPAGVPGGFSNASYIE